MEGEDRVFVGIIEVAPLAGWHDVSDAHTLKRVLFREAEPRFIHLLAEGLGGGSSDPNADGIDAVTARVI